MSPNMENIDSTATDESLTVKYFLAMCDKTGKSLVQFSRTTTDFQLPLQQHAHQYNDKFCLWNCVWY